MTSAVDQRCWTCHIQCQGETNNFNIQRSAKLLIVLQGDWATGEQKYSPENSLSGVVAFQAGSWRPGAIQAEFVDQTMMLSQLYPPTLPHQARADRPNAWFGLNTAESQMVPEEKSGDQQSQLETLSGSPECQNKIVCNSIELISEIISEGQISHCVRSGVCRGMNYCCAETTCVMSPGRTCSFSWARMQWYYNNDIKQWRSKQCVRHRLSYTPRTSFLFCFARMEGFCVDI